MLDSELRLGQKVKVNETCHCQELIGQTGTIVGLRLERHSGCTNVTMSLGWPNDPGDDEWPASELDAVSEDMEKLPHLETWQFQPDGDTPGLYLRLSSLEQRELIMKALGAPVWTKEELDEADREAEEILSKIKWEC